MTNLGDGKPMKIAFLAMGLGVSGGINAVFEHGIYMKDHGEDVYVITRQKNEDIKKWRKEAEKLTILSFDEAKGMNFDVVIATEWRSAYEVFGFKADKYAYFVQSIESRFFEGSDIVNRAYADYTYTLPFSFITEATWIKNYLKEQYGQAAGLVLNGIKKDLFANIKPVEEPRTGHLRVLVEGRLEQPLKNVLATISLVNQSGADEVWLLTGTKTDKVEGVDKLFSAVPLEEVPGIYASCDVLVKLSVVEGMYGPPLEMFHCGGTAITFNVTGSEEYIRHGENALVAEIGDTDRIVEYINQLKNDEKLLETLKDGAVETAKKWRDWQISSGEFYQIIKGLKNNSKEMRMAQKGAELLSSVFDEINKRALVSYGDDSIYAGKLETYHKPVLVYGAGQTTKKFIASLMQSNIEIAGIAVSSMDGNPASVLGYKVRSIEDYLDIKDDVVVFIPSRKFADEIEATLMQKGFKYVLKAADAESVMRGLNG